jgi:hypothetical protein
MNWLLAVSAGWLVVGGVLGMLIGHGIRVERGNEPECLPTVDGAAEPATMPAAMASTVPATLPTPGPGRAAGPVDGADRDTVRPRPLVHRPEGVEPSAR